jgi:uncharacterized protein (DUF1810 family)
MEDTWNLERFVSAQGPVYETVLAELRGGRKRTHWMWFIFPQIQGLGHSDMARRYAISSLDEAQAYLRHPVLGPRLKECCRLVANVRDRSINEIFGSPDDMKFHSCVTLFAEAASTANEQSIFKDCLRLYFGGAPDPATRKLPGVKPQ